MTNSSQNGNSSNRLDRIEILLERVTDRLEQVGEQGQQTAQQLGRLVDRVEQIAVVLQDERILHSEDYNELRNGIATTNQAVETTNRRIDAFITENRANWERYERHKAENDLRFNNLLADARADREEMRRQREMFQQAMEQNNRDHDEFRAAIRSLLGRPPEDNRDR